MSFDTISYAASLEAAGMTPLQATTLAELTRDAMEARQAAARHRLQLGVDTLAYVKRLEAADVPRPQAEAWANALRDALAAMNATARAAEKT